MGFVRKNAVSIIAVLISLFLLVYIFVINNTRVVYVDSGKLLNGYKAMVEARKEFEKKQAVWQSNIDTLTHDVQDAIRQYEKTAAQGTVKEKDLAKQLITSRQKQMYDYQNAVKQNSAQEEQRLTQGVLNTVNAYLLRYGKKHGYKLILVAANGNIAYADNDMDVTDKVVEELNKEYSVAIK